MAQGRCVGVCAGSVLAGLAGERGSVGWPHADVGSTGLWRRHVRALWARCARIVGAWVTRLRGRRRLARRCWRGWGGGGALVTGVVVVVGDVGVVGAGAGLSRVAGSRVITITIAVMRASRATTMTARMAVVRRFGNQGGRDERTAVVKPMSSVAHGSGLVTVGVHAVGSGGADPLQRSGSVAGSGSRISGGRDGVLLVRGRDGDSTGLSTCPLPLAVVPL